MTLHVNDIEIAFAPGETVLVAAQKAGIEIPHLCAHELAAHPAGACRLCVVEVDGTPRLQTSCTLACRDGLRVRTHTPRTLTARRTIVELLVASHPQECLACARNPGCELSRLASDLGARPRRYAPLIKGHALDRSSPAIVRDPDKCVLCGRCVMVCGEVQGVGAIDFAGRGFGTRVVPAFHAGINVSECVSCGQCVRACPTGALTEKSHVDAVVAALGDPRAIVVAQVAPAIPATLFEETGARSVGEALEGLAGALKRIGFGAVFDTSFAADVTVMEEAAELVQRVTTGGVLPLFTSCSPAWVSYVLAHAPELIPHLSTCKSPQQMAGALIKRYWPETADLGGRRVVCVSIMPCTAKKAEAAELGDVDFVLTTRELAQLLRRFGVDPAHPGAPAALDAPFAFASGAARLFAGTGGVAEAALRTATTMLTGKELRGGPKVADARGLEGVRRFEVAAGALTLGVAVVSGLGRLKALRSALAERPGALHLVEVMGCPGGCVAGGGQPHATDLEAVRRRLERLYAADRHARTRAAHLNPAVVELYRRHLGEPLGAVSHDLLHRRFYARDEPAAVTTPSRPPAGRAEAHVEA